VVDPLRLVVGVAIAAVGLVGLLRPDAAEWVTEATGVGRWFGDLSPGQRRVVGVFLGLVGGLFVLGGLTF
jgi:hypothetical protein